MSVNKAINRLVKAAEAHAFKGSAEPADRDGLRKELTDARSKLEVIFDADLRQLVRERARADRLQRILDSRPAINAGLPQTYIDWSHSIYALQAIQATEAAQ